MNIWRILGIEPTKDKELIKKAYLERLMKVNPEDDPEGFQQLRRAYEEACTAADKKEDDRPQWDDGPVGDFMRGVDEIYGHFSRRIDENEWQEILSEDVVLGLDSRETVLEELMVYLMSHHLLPHKIWHLIEETFSLEERKDELTEKFPRDFLDYMLNNARYDDTINYYEFEEKEDDLPYDDYISLYLQLNGLLHRRETEKAEPLFDQLNDLGITHPQGKVAHVRFLLQKEETPIAEFEAEEIFEEYEDKIYVLMMMAEIAWKKEDYAECKEWYERILEKEPEYYGARCGLAECLMQEEDFAGAKKIFRELLNINRFDDYVHKCMLDCNEQLTAQYTQKVAENPMDFDSTVELVWCHYQNYDFDAAQKVLDEMPVPENYYIMDYYYLQGRVALQSERKQDALDAFEKWIEVYAVHKNDDGDPDVMKRNHDRVGLTNFFIAEVYSDLGDANNDLLMYEKALTYNEIAMEHCTIDKGMFLTQHALLCNKLGRFEETIDFAEKAIVEEQNNFEAYMVMGEAFASMEQYREALDQFHNAAMYCPYYAKPYIEQVKIFLQFDAIDRAEEVVNEFLATQAPSLWIKVYQSKIARAKNDYEEAKRLIAEVEEGLAAEDAPQDIQEQDTVYHEKALVHYYCDELEESVEALEKALKIAPKNTRYHYFMGNLLWDQRKHEESVAAFQKAIALDPNNANIYLQMGSVYMDANKSKEAFEAFSKVLELDPKHPQVYGKLGQHYENLGDTAKAIENYTIQLETEPSSYYFISRGLMYMQCGQWKEAEEDFLAAKEMDEHNGYAYYNQARVLMTRGEYEEAENLLRKAIEVSGDNPAFIFYRYLGRLLSRRNRVEEAVEVLQEAMDRQLSNPAFILRYMGDIYATHGYYAEAMRCYREVSEKREDYAALYSMTEVQILAGVRPLSELETELERLKERHSYNDDIKRAYGLLLEALGKKTKAFRVMGDMDDNRLSVTDRYHLACLAKNQRSRQWEDQLTKIEEEMKSELFDHQGRKHSFFQLGRVALSRGQTEEAMKYLRMMKEEPVCDFCNECACYEEYYLQGLIEEALGHKKEAHRQYELAFEISKNDYDVFHSLGGK